MEAIEQFMREQGIRKLGFIAADMLIPRDTFTVELEESWLAEHIGTGPTIGSRKPRCRKAIAHI